MPLENIHLGEEFLTWLWFCSEVRPSDFVTKNGQLFIVSIEQKIVVQGGEGDSLETATVTGSFSSLREARLGLSTGKKVTSALLCFEKDELTWQCTLKATNFSIVSLSTPKVSSESKDDLDAPLLEKIYLIETFFEYLDTCYALFLSIRTSNKWTSEVEKITHWIKQNK